MKKNKIIQEEQQFNQKYKDAGFEVVSLFGSFARGTEDAFSDIDLTYKIDHNIFFKDDAFAKLEKIEKIKKELEHTFHRQVDLIPANSKNVLIQESLKEEQLFI